MITVFLGLVITLLVAERAATLPFGIEVTSSELSETEIKYYWNRYAGTSPAREDISGSFYKDIGLHVYILGTGMDSDAPWPADGKWEQWISKQVGWPVPCMEMRSNGTGDWRNYNRETWKSYFNWVVPDSLAFIHHLGFKEFYLKPIWRSLVVNTLFWGL